MRKFGFAGAVALGTTAANALANDQSAVVPVPAVAGAAPQANDAPELVVPALTPLVIRLEADLGSRLNKTGDRFPLSLAEPVLIAGVTVLPAGLLGEGEVVHAKKSGGSGAGGELVVAARWLEVGGKRLKLRSLRLNVAGKDAIQKIDSLNAASAASPVPLGLLGFFIKGKNAVHAKGDLAEAKTAEAFSITNPEFGGDSAKTARQVQQEDLK
ncbi:hypothetical protein [Novosphingobium sp. AAP83]|uniref:hypothetical protein n=1 Tax=Novosphingobium sp. AAP83 TaxID=1523425 RepID=UPI0006B9E345|nr:hypothetical protein [Novosphingobium sp. AAP83]